MTERKPIDPELRSLWTPGRSGGRPSADLKWRVGSLRRALLVRALEGRRPSRSAQRRQARDVAISGMLTGRLYTPPRGRRRCRYWCIYMAAAGCWLGCNARPVLPPPQRGGRCDHRLGRVPAGARASSPAALEDALAAVQWAASNAALWGGDPARLALGGDSAGAHLAAVAANRLFGQAGAPALRALLLLYPVTDHPARIIFPTPRMPPATGSKRI